MFIDTVIGGLTDPFRIGLLVALWATMLRTRANTGTLVPLAAGVLFVAVIIPVTMGPATEGPGLVGTVLAGIASNVVIVAVIAALWAAWTRLRA